MNVSYEEKSAWIMLAALLVVFAFYALGAAGLESAGVREVRALLPLFIVGVIALVIILATGHAVVAVLSRPDGRDERDRLIGWRAESQSTADRTSSKIRTSTP